MPEVWEGKSYKMTDSENFDDYMKELGKRNKFFLFRSFVRLYILYQIEPY